MSAVFVVDDRGILSRPALVDEDIIGNDERQVVRREKPVFLVIDNRIVVEVGKPGEGVLHKKRQTAACCCDVLDPQGINRVLAHEDPGPPPLA